MDPNCAKHDPSEGLNPRRVPDLSLLCPDKHKRGQRGGVGGSCVRYLCAWISKGALWESEGKGSPLTTPPPLTHHPTLPIPDQFRASKLRTQKRHRWHVDPDFVYALRVQRENQH